MGNPSPKMRPWQPSNSSALIAQACRPLDPSRRTNIRNRWGTPAGLGADRRFCYAEGYCAIAHNAGEHSLAIESEAGDITVLLREWTAGDAEACDRLMPHVYPHLREVATRL